MSVVGSCPGVVMEASGGSWGGEEEAICQEHSLLHSRELLIWTSWRSCPSSLPHCSQLLSFSAQRVWKQEGVWGLPRGGFFEQLVAGGEEARGSESWLLSLYSYASLFFAHAWWQALLSCQHRKPEDQKPALGEVFFLNGSA